LCQSPKTPVVFNRRPNLHQTSCLLLTTRFAFLETLVSESAHAKEPALLALCPPEAQNSIARAAQQWVWTNCGCGTPTGAVKLRVCCNQKPSLQALGRWHRLCFLHLLSPIKDMNARPMSMNLHTHTFIIVHDYRPCCQGVSSRIPPISASNMGRRRAQTQKMGISGQETLWMAAKAHN
jgi:hypothetical protein